MRWSIEWAVAGGIVGVLAVFAGWLHHHGYTRGVAERTAFYEPILRRAAEAKIAADQRAQAADQRAIRITAAVEIDHAQTEQDLLARASAAELRIASLLRQHDAPAACGGQPVPAVSRTPIGSDGPARSDPRDDRLAGRVSGVGGRCERDADKLAQWQEWYDRQRASLNQPPPVETP